jgi:thiamine biosynthesis protein ThiI
MGLLLLRYGELALKGHNRFEFVRQLRHNVRACLKAHGLAGEVLSVGQRVYVRAEATEEVVEALGRVFGLVSLSAVAEVPLDMDAIAAECVAQARAAGVRPGVSYRVQARRADKTFPFISPQINRLCGEAIYAALEGVVDLSAAAQVTIGVEVAEKGALVFSQQLAAPGGLPLGIEGRAVALISGGIDSPVATWMMMKRGCSIIPVHFSQNEVETRKALDNIAALGRYSYGWAMHPIVLDHRETIAPTLEALRDLGAERWGCLFCKRALLLKACEIAAEKNAHAIVMGDSLGQVASQSLANLEVVSYGIPKPILRPLIGLDKAEIMAMARRIGTFDISTRAAEGCVFLPAHPITRGTVEQLREIIAELEERKG